MVVTQASQTINFTQPTSPVTYASGLQIALTATGGASGNPSSDDPRHRYWLLFLAARSQVTSTSNLVIDANQTGNTNYSAATQVQRTIVVNTLIAQAINFTQPTSPVTYASGWQISSSATGGGSENPVFFAIDGSTRPAISPAPPSQ